MHADPTTHSVINMAAAVVVKELVLQMVLVSQHLPWTSFNSFSFKGHLENDI